MEEGELLSVYFLIAELDESALPKRGRPTKNILKSINFNIIEKVLTEIDNLIIYHISYRSSFIIFM